MDLPNYFLADLPDASTLSPTLITEACDALKKNRDKFLRNRTTDSIVTVLATLARDWVDDEFPFRKRTLEEGPAHTGFSRETIAHGLNEFFSQLAKEKIEALIAQDLGSVRRLDELVSDEVEVKQDRASIARARELIVHITGGVLPNPTLTSMVLGLLARSAQFIKCASGTSFIPRMFAHSLYLVQPKLAACIEVAEWKGGHEALEHALFAQASCVTATGSDETLENIRKRVPARAPFFGYGHKLSFGCIARESLGKIGLHKVLAAAAGDISTWDQLGCLSPHVLYVETGGATPVPGFAELLAKELERLHVERPRGRVSHETAAAISTRKMFYEVRAANSDGTKVWASPNSTAWTVVYEEDPQFQVSCLHRFIFVKPVADLKDVFHSAAAVHGRVSTVGVSAPAHRAQEMAVEFARWGVTRVCPLGKMQNPPLTWRHDGRPALGDLVVWTDLELS